LNRRAFFKVVGAVAAASALPLAGATKLLGLDAPVASGSMVLGLIRETVAYDISTDLHLARFDILTGDQQFCVDTRFKSPDELAHCREVAHEVLERKMVELGKTWADLRPLPSMQHLYPTHGS
jgi:hypothetical protein